MLTKRVKLRNRKFFQPADLTGQHRHQGDPRGRAPGDIRKTGRRSGLKQSKATQSAEGEPRKSQGDAS